MDYHNGNLLDKREENK